MDKKTPEAALIRRIAGVVGHELRNPLAVINNSAYFLKAKLGGGADPKVAKHLGIIESEIARADRLIGDIAAYARPCEPRPAEFSLNALATELLDEYEAAAPGRKIARELASGELRVRGDKDMVAEVLRRLLDNALDAAGAAGAVAVSTAAQKSGAVITVSDTGPGVDPKVRDTLCEPFVTTKPRGLGLGLAFAKKVLSAHGGTLAVSDRRGGGTAAVATLPGGK